jgi:adenine-specific DNA-methyltransferase
MGKKRAKKKTEKKTVEAFKHEDASRTNIPTAEYQSVMGDDDKSPIRVAYDRRNRDLDPQLVWRGKDDQDWSDLVVHAPPLYIQEKVHPKVLVDELMRRQKKEEEEDPFADMPLFRNLHDDFNGLPEGADKTDFYEHEGNWSNRMILGDSLQVMASMAEREGLRGKVQCIYIDPPYGIKFNSNFQWSTTSRDVKDGKADHITREPEQVKAFRDTWRDGIHSYLTYLRDRLTVARDLLTESGSIFVQIGDENVHRVRALMDEVFGEDNFVVSITFKKTSGSSSDLLASVADTALWYTKSKIHLKHRQLLRAKEVGGDGGSQYVWLEDEAGFRRRATRDEIADPPKSARFYQTSPINSQRPRQGTDVESFQVDGRIYFPGKGTFKTNLVGLTALLKSRRLQGIGKTLRYVRFLGDFPAFPYTNVWNDTVTSGFSDPKLYIVQTQTTVVQRCILMATDPGDLVLDPTCGSGTTATVAEQWGRRWITIDTSRVALALARARIMGARYPFYLLSDSPEGQGKEADVTRTETSEVPTHGNIKHGFVYQRVPHITLKSIANNSEIDIIWASYQEKLEPLREELNNLLKQKWEEWEIPRETEDDWSKEAKKLHKAWWKARIARQKEIDASIAAKADFEYLYDKPYEDKKKVRVAGPFTVESISPHRVMAVDEDDELIDPLASKRAQVEDEQDFVRMILDNLKTAGVQQAHKEDKIEFSTIAPWPGHFVCAEGVYNEGNEESGAEKRAGIFIGPEFGTVSKPDLVAAAREAGDAGFDVLIACAFNYDAHSSEFDKLGRVPVLKARMNADLHMADDLKKTAKGNLFVIFGEPDIDIIKADRGKFQVKINGVDVFHPNTGEVRSDGAEGIACWFIDTDYNEESFFVRHAYFLGANDPYKALKTSLKAEIDADAWSSLNSDTSRPFRKPKSGRIAVKVINHLGDEVMKVYRV